MKECSKCNIEKPLKQFHLRKGSSDGYAGQCKRCKCSYARSRYKNNPEENRNKGLKARKKAYDYITTYLSTHPCVDCGETDRVVLDFDHRDGVDKKAAVGRLRRTNCSIETLKIEIEKCEVRCANCHRRRTAKQFNWYTMYTGESVYGQSNESTDGTTENSCIG